MKLSFSEKIYLSPPLPIPPLFFMQTLWTMTSDNDDNFSSKKQCRFSQRMKDDCLAAAPYSNLYDCASSECSSFIHLECYTCLTTRKVNPIVTDEPHHKAYPVCSLRCYKVFMKDLTAKAKPKASRYWHNDGFACTLQVTSLSLLAQWRVCMYAASNIIVAFDWLVDNRRKW